MKTGIVDSKDISAKKGLRAEGYVGVESVPESAWSGMAEVIRVCHQTSRSKGWWNKYDALKAEMPNLFTSFWPEIASSKLMLMVSELSEALEEIRENDGGLYFTHNVEEGGVKFRTACQADAPGAKPEGFGVELADAVIRIFDLAHYLRIDLPKLIQMKMAYNQTRPHLHGGKAI